MSSRNSKPGKEGIAQFLEKNYATLARAIEGLEDHELNWRPSPRSNTIGNLLKHIAGSEAFWILHVAGGLETDRDRPSEFENKEFRMIDLRAELDTVKELSKRILTELNDEILAESRTFKIPWAPCEGEQQATVHWCVMHAIEHSSGHIGQIFYIRKMYADREQA